MNLYPGLILPWMAAVALAGQSVAPEEQLLAGSVRLILAHVAWRLPEGAPLRIAVVGGPALEEDFTKAFGAGTVGGRKASLRFLSAARFLGDSDAFEAVFLDQDEDPRLGQILARIQGKAILTLGRGGGFAERGVMVNFYREGTRLRFEINPLKLKEANLSLNPRVLQLGRAITP